MNSFSKFIFRNQHLALLLILAAFAFTRTLQSYNGLSYGCDQDSYRDLSNVENLFEGNYGKDPSYIGEYLWYNPLIAFIEAGTTKLTGIQPMSLVTKGGALLNLLSVFSFYFMVSYLFGSSIAIASAVAFIFFTSGNIPSWGSATYSPWLYPQNLIQTIFYLGIICCFKAFRKPGFVNFIIAGIIAGLAFLGHTAPALILLFITTMLFVKKIYSAAKINSTEDLNKFLRFGLLFGLAFFIVSLPLTFFVVGKYKLHMVNTITFEYNDPLFTWFNFMTLLKENISFTLPLVIIGCYYVFCKHEDKLKRSVLYYWFYACVIFFIYTSAIVILHVKWNLRFPGLVPPFHFFFYLKALQSLLFGAGIIYLLKLVFKKIKKIDLENGRLAVYTSLVILILFILYYPVYNKRTDFYFMRDYGLRQSASTDEIEIYHWLLKNSTINDVIVCDEDFSCFPVMASGRKLVAVIATMSNPYVSYVKRDNDRKKMLTSLLSGNIKNARQLMSKYIVKYILLENRTIINKITLENNFGAPVFKNNKFSLYQNP